jgi:hypothetical protein
MTGYMPARSIASSLLDLSSAGSERTCRASAVLPSSNTTRGPRRTVVPRCHPALGAIPVCLSLAGNAAAETPRATNGADSSSFVLELRTFAGAAGLELRDTDETLRVAGSRAVVDYDAIAWGVGARAGWDTSPYVRLGATVSVTGYWRTGKLQVRDAEALADELFQFDDSPSLWAPGAFLEISPVRDLGVFLGLTLSLGYVPSVSEPRPNTIDAPMYLGGYALEAGYQSNRSSPHALGVFLRYSAWTGKESPFFTDFPESMSLGELTLGARWAFRP